MSDARSNGQGVGPVGFVGVGQQGGPMAANLVAAGYHLIVRDLDPARERGFVDAYGCLACDGDVSKLASAGVVMTMLPNGDTVRDALLGYGGAANSVLHFLGFAPVQFLGAPTLALASVTLVSVWQLLGFSVVVMVAGLQAVPGELLDASRVDGATRFQMQLAQADGHAEGDDILMADDAGDIRPFDVGQHCVKPELFYLFKRVGGVLARTYGVAECRKQRRQGLEDVGIVIDNEQFILLQLDHLALVSSVFFISS